MMSEKRFQIIHLGNPYEFVVKDNTTNKTYGPFEGDEKSMSDLLNEQQATISQLQDLCGESDSENAKLRIENEQLKSELHMRKMSATIDLMSRR